MTKEYEFLKKCKSFFVLTVNGDFPAGRPFGAVMEHKGNLYIATNDKNEVHKQLRANGNVQLLAKYADTRDWMRLTGIATECNDIALKEKMMEECPVLLKHYTSPECEHYLLFCVQILHSEFY